MKHVTPGSILYLETKIFSDPITGLVRRIREIAVRQNGRLVFLGEIHAIRNERRRLLLKSRCWSVGHRRFHSSSYFISVIMTNLTLLLAMVVGISSFFHFYGMGDFESGGICYKLCLSKILS